MRRLARLPEGVRQGLGVAAVCGLEFDLSTLQQVGPLRGASLIDALDAAVRANVVQEGEEPGRYRFKHGLVGEVLYETMSRTKRAWLHARIGEAIEQWAESDPARSLPLLAHHFSEATVDEGAKEKAIAYCQQAGHRALRLGAPKAAARHFERGLQVLESTRPLDEALCCDLLLALGQALTGALERRSGPARLPPGGLAGPVVRIRRATAPSCRRCSPCVDHRRARTRRCIPVARAARRPRRGAPRRASAPPCRGGRRSPAVGIGDERPPRQPRRPRPRSTIRGPAVAEDGSGHTEPGAVGAALVRERLGVGRELAELCADTGDRDGLLDGIQLQGVPLLELGDTRAFDLLTAELHERGTEIGSRAAVAQVVQWRTMRALMAGRLDDAQQGLEHLVDTVGDVSDFALGIALQRCALHRQQDLGPQLLEGATSLVESHPGLPLGRAMLAATHAAAGRRHEAQSALDCLAVRNLADAEADWSRTAVLALTAEACVALGARAPAALLYDLMRPHQGQLVVVASGTSCEGAVTRYLGLLAGALERWEDAVEHFESALTLERGVDAPPLVARTQLSYAGVLAARDRPGDRRRVRDLLFAAERTADRLGQAGVTRQAADLRTSLLGD